MKKVWVVKKVESMLIPGGYNYKPYQTFQGVCAEYGIPYHETCAACLIECERKQQQLNNSPVS